MKTSSQLSLNRLKIAVTEIVLLIILLCMAVMKSLAANYTWTNLSAQLPANASISDMAWLSNHFSHKIFLATGTSILQVNDDSTVTTISSIGNYSALYQKVDAGYLWFIDGSTLRIYSESQDLSEFGISISENVRELWASDTKYKGYAVGNMGISLFDALWGTVTAKTTPGVGSISDVWAVDNAINSVYALSANGIVYRSTDGATSWTAVSGATDIRAMYFRNFNQGWAAGSNGHVYKLNTSGSWEQKYAGGSNEFCSIAFTTSGSCGVAVGENGTAFFSGDEGETWTQLQVDAGSIEITKAIITEDKKIYLAGNKALFVGIPDSTTGNNNLPALVQMVSVQIDGDPPVYESYGSSVSDDGNYVAFVSRDDELIANDTYDTKDFFLWNGSSQSITLTNTLADGTRVERNLNYSQISGDGKWIVMSNEDFLLKNREDGSVAKYVTGEDYYGQIDMSSDGTRVLHSQSLTNSHTALCLYNRITNSKLTIEMGYYGSGVGTGSHIFEEDAISGDGSTVVYSTLDYTIVADPGGGTAMSNMVKSVYVYAVGGTSYLLFQSSYTDFGYSYQGVTNFSLNYDGRYFVHRDENGQIKLWNLKTGTSEIVSISTLGEQANGECWATGISANGRYVVFYSAASNLVPNDTNGKFDVFLRDRITGKTTLVSTNIAGNPSTERSNRAISGSQNLSISADGQYVTFESQADNLVSTPKNSFVRCIFWAMLDVEKDNPETLATVPVDLAVSNCIIATGDTCFDATNEITVSTVTVGDNASANFIAGHSVTFLPGFHAVEGSYVHALITEDGSFCDAAGGSPIVEKPALKSVENQAVPKKQTINSGEKAIKVYPNPNNGQFTLELSNIESGAIVNVYNILGAKVYQSNTTNEALHKISLPDIERGIYFLKVMDGKEQFTKKMIVN